MTDLEISKALALAIGWGKDSVAIHHDMWEVMVHAEPNPFGWKVFNYQDWNVIGPIAAKYDCFPYGWYHNAGIPCWRSSTDLHEANADTPQKAIALAVIEGAKK